MCYKKSNSVNQKSRLHKTDITAQVWRGVKISLGWLTLLNCHGKTITSHPWSLLDNNSHYGKLDSWNNTIIVEFNDLN